MKVSTKEMQEMAADRMAMGSRLRYTALLLVGLGGAGVVGSLWLTEPALAVRAQVGFALILAINLAWAGFAGWVLTRRRVLLARHSVVAARMAVAFSAVFVLFAWGAGYWGGAGRPMYAASGFGVVMLGVAMVMLILAGRRFDGLVQRRRELERSLGERAVAGSGKAALEQRP